MVKATAYILSGLSWTTNTIYYSFYQPGQNFTGTAEKGLRKLSSSVELLVEKVLETIELLVDVNFIKIKNGASTSSCLMYAYSTTPEYAYAYLPPSDSSDEDFFGDYTYGDVFLSISYNTSAAKDESGFLCEPGDYGYSTLIHETLHALGLTHPFDKDSNLAQSEAPLSVDNTTNTVMTYSYSSAQSTTPMPIDIQALQSLYGANIKPSSKNTTYKFTSTCAYSFGEHSIGSSKQSYSALYDYSGSDTLDFRNLKASVTAVLTDSDGYISYTKDLGKGQHVSYSNSDDTFNTLASGTFVCDNTILEKVLGTSLADVFAGGSSANTFYGYKGNDRLSGGAGNDKLYGGIGDDNLTGGAGDDVLNGQAGVDRLKGGAGKDRFIVSSFSLLDSDKILDFDSTEDIIAVQSDIFDASEDDTIEVVSYAQLRSKKDGLYDDLGVDVLVVKDTTANLKKLNTEGYDKAIHLGIVTDKKLLVYDEDGDWRSTGDQVKLMDFTSKFSTAWTGDNFLLGYQS